MRHGPVQSGLLSQLRGRFRTRSRAAGIAARRHPAGICRHLLTPLCALLLASCGAQGTGPVISDAPPAALRSAEPGRAAVAMLAGGCFWTVEAVFSHVRGVTAVEAGYHGGTARQARYDLVTTGLTDHAEAVRITYDPSIIRYDQLLRVHLGVAHDPAQHNRQGPDEGSEYRSLVIPVSSEQHRVAEAYLAQIAADPASPLATRIEPYRRFFRAEAHHQDFAHRHPAHPYVRRWDAPRIAALARVYPQLYSGGWTAR